MLEATHYYSVEEQQGHQQLKRLMSQLRKAGACLCIVSAGAGELHPDKQALARALGFTDSEFLRGYRKFEQVIQWLQQRHKLRDDNSTSDDSGNEHIQYHTLVLIDDTLEYINAWQRQGQAILEQQQNFAFLAPNPQLTAIHYDFINQHQDFIQQQMLQEFLELYGEDYQNHPGLQRFLKQTEAGKNGKSAKKDKDKNDRCAIF
ncbi:MAG: hypothetical protein ABFQ95_06210 [Pseudomonadota bacterium]